MQQEPSEEVTIYHIPSKIVSTHQDSSKDNPEHQNFPMKFNALDALQKSFNTQGPVQRDSRTPKTFQIGVNARQTPLKTQCSKYLPEGIKTHKEPSKDLLMHLNLSNDFTTRQKHPKGFITQQEPSEDLDIFQKCFNSAKHYPMRLQRFRNLQTLVNVPRIISTNSCKRLMAHEDSIVSKEVYGFSKSLEFSICLDYFYV